MRMKSVLALSALSAATFLAGAVYAAEAQTTTQTDQTVKKTQTQTVQSTKAAPSTSAVKSTETVKSVQTDQAAPVTETAVKTEHKKHHARHKHHRKHHRHHHQKHHHHHRHHEHFVYARDYAEVPCWNFLVGGSLGYAAQKEDFITRYTRPLVPLGAGPGPAVLNPVPMPIYIDNSKKITDQGVLFGLLAGWQWHYKRWMFGAEASLDFDSFEKDRQFAFTEASAGPQLATSQSAIVGTVLYDRGDIYAITARAGYFVTPFFMPYLRLGAQLSRDEVSYQSLTSPILVTVGGVPAALVNAAYPDYSSRKKDVYGVVAGIGAEFPTYIGASTIRFEYNFVKTESVIIEDNTLPVIGNHKFRYPESHIGKIAWVWNFM